ncbi:uncharacterized protein BJ171DRAFT_480289 [Polychytrium aggregatum]|uniref:uncharacterized protein n=1 Tax=Polychytrium aggregatum TaxID=110093 RepID=UPI0022FDDC0C|nr:uncharacterized protein BJ171DRAFT_480289 [Polychytrium aggregatum]KAI9193211.1 hypothetical protein BJ171DRAFT_480289 [Polychytrium aggregatum]
MASVRNSTRFSSRLFSKSSIPKSASFAPKATPAAAFTFSTSSTSSSASGSTSGSTNALPQQTSSPSGAGLAGLTSIPRVPSAIANARAQQSQLALLVSQGSSQNDGVYSSRSCPASRPLALGSPGQTLIADGGKQGSS